jgi:YegS/Rv2252/BmrU family lipid kinase
LPRFIIYIINPISGTKSKTDLQELIEKKTTENNIPYLVIPSVANGDYSFLDPIIKEKKVTDIVIAGGDGTINQVVGDLKNCKLNFGIIPCGSGNGLAFTAKIPKNPAKALDVVFKGNASQVDGFYINKKFSCMLCGLGFDAKVAYDFARQPKRGLMTYISQTVKNFFNAKTYDFEISLKDKTFPVSAYFISIANSNQFGNNFTIAPKASISDGLLDIVIVTAQSKISMLMETLKQVSGNNKLADREPRTGKKGVMYFQTSELVIQNKSKAPFHIDGDPAASPKSLHIKISEKCFFLLQP